MVPFNLRMLLAFAFGEGRWNFGVTEVVRRRWGWPMTMTFTSPYRPAQIEERLRDQLDEIRSGIRSIFPSKPMSPVCGKVGDREFELRSTWGSGVLCSLRAMGRLTESKTGSEIELWFEEAIVVDPISSALDRSKYDKERILEFLRTWIKIKPKQEPSKEAFRRQESGTLGERR